MRDYVVRIDLVARIHHDDGVVTSRVIGTREVAALHSSDRARGLYDQIVAEAVGVDTGSPVVDATR